MLDPGGAAGKPIVMRDGPDPLTRGSQRFEGPQILAALGTRFFTFSGAWMIARALWLGRFDTIELCGFQLARDHQYDFERPCFFYWVARARAAGVTVIVPPEVGSGDPGDPAAYTGPVYGYETTAPIVRI